MTISIQKYFFSLRITSLLFSFYILLHSLLSFSQINRPIKVISLLIHPKNFNLFCRLANLFNWNLSYYLMRQIDNVLSQILDIWQRSTYITSIEDLFKYLSLPLYLCPSVCWFVSSRERYDNTKQHVMQLSNFYKEMTSHFHLPHFLTSFNFFNISRKTLCTIF